MAVNEAKYVLMNNDFLAQPNESSDFDDLVVVQSTLQQPPSYANVVEHSNQSYSATLQNNQHLSNQRPLPVTSQPRSYVVNTRSSTVQMPEPESAWKAPLCDCCASTSVCK